MEEKEDKFHLDVKALIFNKERKLLLLQAPPKKYSSSKENRWDIPGGRIQKNESLEEALKREVYEETGLQNITQITPFTMALSNIRILIKEDDVGLIFATYLCKLEGDISISLSNEHVYFEWFDPGKAAELLSKHFPTELTRKIANLSEELIPI